MTRWVVLVTLLAGILVSLALHGLLGPATGGRRVGALALDQSAAGGPVLAVGDDSVRSAPGEPGTVGIALVSTGADDVPAEAASALSRHGTAATWFVRGRELLDHPDAVARLRAGRGEIGVTGFSGADLAGLPAWQVRVELSSAQAVLAAREGITTPLLLLPSSATRATVDRPAVAAARTAADQG